MCDSNPGDVGVTITPNGVFHTGKGTRVAEIADGMSKTIAGSEFLIGPASGGPSTQMGVGGVLPQDRQRIAVSTGLLQQMDREQVSAVLGHEIGHVANGDMVTLTLIQGVLNTLVIIAARIVGYIRQAAIGDPLVPYDQRVDGALQKLLASHQWSTPQRQWLQKIAAQTKANILGDREALDDPDLVFRREGGGFARLDRIFGGELQQVLDTFNESLWAAA